MNLIKAMTVILQLVFFFLIAPAFAQVSSSVFTAVGQDYESGFPLLVVSNDGYGKVWRVKQLSGWNEDGWFNTSSCIGTGSSAVCLAAGKEGSFGLPSHPLLYVSRDGGDSWQLTSIPELDPDISFAVSSCTGNSGPSSLCIVAGTTSYQSVPILIASADGGNTWSKQSITQLTGAGKGRFTAASCTGAGTAAVCVVLGYPDPNSGDPYLVVTNDGGTTWKNKTIPGLPKSSSYSAVSCTGSGSTATCFVTGNYFDNGSSIALLARSVDGGATWKLENIAGLPKSGMLDAVSCTSSSIARVCVIAGYYFTPYYSPAPLLVVSADGGITWEIKTDAQFPVGGMFTTISCSGSGSTAVCATTGTAMQDASEHAIFAVSNDGGKSWKMKSVPERLTFSNINSVHCSGVGVTSVCMVTGGYYVHEEQPLLVVSTNGGDTWGEQFISGITSYGQFLEGSATT